MSSKHLDPQARERFNVYLYFNDDNGFLVCFFPGCPTEETLGGPKCNSSTVPFRADAELHDSSGNDFYFVSSLIEMLFYILGHGAAESVSG